MSSSTVAEQRPQPSSLGVSSLLGSSPLAQEPTLAIEILATGVTENILKHASTFVDTQPNEDIVGTNGWILPQASKPNQSGSSTPTSDRSDSPTNRGSHANDGFNDAIQRAMAGVISDIQSPPSTSANNTNVSRQSNTSNHLTTDAANHSEHVVVEQSKKLDSHSNATVVGPVRSRSGSSVANQPAPAPIRHDESSSDGEGLYGIQAAPKKPNESIDVSIDHEQKKPVTNSPIDDAFFDTQTRTIDDNQRPSSAIQRNILDETTRFGTASPKSSASRVPSAASKRSIRADEPTISSDEKHAQVSPSKLPNDTGSDTDRDNQEVSNVVRRSSRAMSPFGRPKSPIPDDSNRALTKAEPSPTPTAQSRDGSVSPVNHPSDKSKAAAETRRTSATGNHSKSPSPTLSGHHQPGEEKQHTVQQPSHTGSSPASRRESTNKIDQQPTSRPSSAAKPKLDDNSLNPPASRPGSSHVDEFPLSGKLSKLIKPEQSFQIPTNNMNDGTSIEQVNSLPAQNQSRPSSGSNRGSPISHEKVIEKDAASSTSRRESNIDLQTAPKGDQQSSSPRASVVGQQTSKAADSRRASNISQGPTIPTIMAQEQQVPCASESNASEHKIPSRKGSTVSELQVPSKRPSVVSELQIPSKRPSVASEQQTIADEPKLSSKRGSTVSEQKTSGRPDSANDKPNLSSQRGSTAPEQPIQSRKASVASEQKVSSRPSSGKDEPGVSSKRGSLTHEHPMPSRRDSFTEEAPVSSKRGSTAIEKPMPSRKGSDVDAHSISSRRSIAEEPKVSSKRASTVSESLSSKPQETVNEEPKISSRRSSAKDETKLSSKRGSTALVQPTANRRESDTDEPKYSSRRSSTTDEPHVVSKRASNIPDQHRSSHDDGSAPKEKGSSRKGSTASEQQVASKRGSFAAEQQQGSSSRRESHLSEKQTPGHRQSSSDEHEPKLSSKPGSRKASVAEQSQVASRRESQLKPSPSRRSSEHQDHPSASPRRSYAGNAPPSEQSSRRNSDTRLNDETPKVSSRRQSGSVKDEQHRPISSNLKNDSHHSPSTAINKSPREITRTPDSSRKDVPSPTTQNDDKRRASLKRHSGQKSKRNSNILTDETTLTPFSSGSAKIRSQNTAYLSATDSDHDHSTPSKLPPVNGALQQQGKTRRIEESNKHSMPLSSNRADFKPLSSSHATTPSEDERKEHWIKRVPVPSIHLSDDEDLSTLSGHWTKKVPAPSIHLSDDEMLSSRKDQTRPKSQKAEQIAERNKPASPFTITSAAKKRSPIGGQNSREPQRLSRRSNSADSVTHIRLVDDQSLDSASENNADFDRHKRRQHKMKSKDIATNTDRTHDEQDAYDDTRGMYQQQPRSFFAEQEYNSPKPLKATKPMSDHLHAARRRAAQKEQALTTPDTVRDTDTPVVRRNVRQTKDSGHDKDPVNVNVTVVVKKFAGSGHDRASRTTAEAYVEERPALSQHQKQQPPAIIDQQQIQEPYFEPAEQPPVASEPDITQETEEKPDEILERPKSTEQQTIASIIPTIQHDERHTQSDTEQIITEQQKKRRRPKRISRTCQTYECVFRRMEREEYQDLRATKETDKNMQTRESQLRPGKKSPKKNSPLYLSTDSFRVEDFLPKQFHQAHRSAPKSSPVARSLSPHGGKLIIIRPTLPFHHTDAVNIQRICLQYAIDLIPNDHTPNGSMPTHRNKLTVLKQSEQSNNLPMIRPMSPVTNTASNKSHTKEKSTSRKHEEHIKQRTNAGAH